MELRVLIVEDSAPIRILLAQVLANRGDKPIEVATGEQALKVALADPPDVAVVDHHLPGLTGAEVIRTFRHSASERLRALPIVGISGLPGSDHDLLKVGADAFVRKPFREADLVDAIARARKARLPGRPAAPSASQRTRGTRK